MTTKINATDVNVMTFNADPFLASDEYGEEELQALLNEAYITELNGFDAEQAREMLDYFDDDDVRVYKGVTQEGDVFYFSTNCPTSLEGLDTPSYCKVVDTTAGKAIVGFASFAEAEEIANVLDKMNEDEILVVFNDIPELTYEVWSRYKVGYHDYDVHQYEIGLKK